MATFLILTEQNSWEHETWHFYLEATKHNQEAFDLIKKIPGLPSSFRFSETNITKEDIENLSNSTSYLSTHNVISGRLDMDKIRKIMKYNDEFYKGGIEGFIIDESIIYSLDSSMKVDKIQLSVNSTRLEKKVIPFSIRILFTDGKQYMAKSILNVPSSETKQVAKKMLLELLQSNSEFKDVKHSSVSEDNIEFEALNLWMDKNDIVKYNDDTKTYEVYPHFWTDYYDSKKELVQEYFNLYDEPILLQSDPDLEAIKKALQEKDSLIGIGTLMR